MLSISMCMFFCGRKFLIDLGKYQDMRFLGCTVWAMLIGGISLFYFAFPGDTWEGASFHVLNCHLSFFFGEETAKIFDPFLD